MIENGRKAQEFAHRGLSQAPLVPEAVLQLPWAPLAPLHAPLAPGCVYFFACNLFSKLDRCKKPSFLLLNYTQTFAIKRDPCTHYYSFRTLTVQVKGQTSQLQGIISFFSYSF